MKLYQPYATLIKKPYVGQEVICYVSSFDSDNICFAEYKKNYFLVCISFGCQNAFERVELKDVPYWLPKPKFKI